MSLLLEAVDLRRTFLLGGEEVRALDGVSLQIEAGEFVSIVGPSGCGKSSLLQILGLLDRPDAGEYRIEGRDVLRLGDRELSDLRSRHLAFIFQFFNLLPRTTARRNVALPLLYQGAPPAYAESRASEALSHLDLSHRAEHGPSELSGGEQQRVAIARALAARPRILFADEPTGNLNSSQSEEILDRLLELNRRGITVLLVTHDEGVAARAPRRIRMRDGKILTDSGSVTPPPPLRFEEAEAFSTTPPVFAPKLAENFRSAAVSLRANALRTGLAMLGALVGTASLITMMAVGAGARAQARERIEKLGSNLMLLLPDRGGDGGQEAPTPLDLDDAEAVAALASGDSGLRGVNPVIALSPVTISKGGASASSRVLGVSVRHPAMHNSPPAFGRFFSLEEDARLEKVCVLGAGAAGALFESPAGALGKTVSIRGLHFQVVGVLGGEGASGSSDLDQQVLVPVRTALKRLANRRTLSYLEIETAGPESEAAIEAAVTGLLRARHSIPDFRGSGFKLRSLVKIQKALSGVARTLSILLGVVSAASLLVGGIGIMNIMLVSVRERTREIGLRKAMGARKRDVLSQFLVESAAIGTAGGAVGILVGLACVRVSASLTGWPVLVEPMAPVVAAAFSFLTGAVSGFWPAYQASELEPARALRFE